MRKRLVIWGVDENDKRVLVGIALNIEENLIDLYIFHEDLVTEDFYKDFVKKWGQEEEEIEFPEGYNHLQRTLSASESILPDNIKADNPDMVSRTQMEWQFLVLAEKLYAFYKDELEKLKEKVQEITEFNKDLWEELKSYSKKLNEQIRSRMLFKKHSDELKSELNNLFQKLKELRDSRSVDPKLAETSKKILENVKEMLAEVKEKFEKDIHKRILFEDLKKIENYYKEQFSKILQPDRRTIYRMIDDMYKTIKKARIKSAHETDEIRRTQSRIEGIDRWLKRHSAQLRDLEREIERLEQKNIVFNQLEQQLRELRINIIKEKIAAKKNKIQELKDLRKELETRLEKLQAQAATSEASADLAQQRDETSEAESQTTTENLTEGEASTDESLLEKAEEIIESTKAIAKAVSDKAKEVLEDVVEEVKEESSEIVEEVKEFIGEAVEKIEELVESREESQEREKDAPQGGSTDESTVASSATGEGEQTEKIQTEQGDDSSVEDGEELTSQEGEAQDNEPKEESASEAEEEQTS